jgi:bacillithiol system protein YtxJ
MNWNKLNSIAQINEIDNYSNQNNVLIFKHSTRCSISITALGRLERNWKEQDDQAIKPYYLDLLENRAVSNHIAEHYELQHESPQVLIISKGKLVYHESHSNIRYEDIINFKY